MPTRRTFLTTVAAGALPSSPTRSTLAGPLSQDEGAASSRARSITEATIAEAEKIVGVAHTPAERELMVRNLPRQRDVARARPRPPLSGGDVPATEFHPRRPPPRTIAPATASPARAIAVDESGLAFASIADLGAALRARRLTSVTLARASLDRLARLDPKLRCVVTSCDERALSEARRADEELARGKDRGPLHGIPYGVKDLFDTSGIATTWGAAPFAHRVPNADSAVVSLLTAAGGVLVAKLSLGELAMGDVWFAGRTNNPWNAAEGSSGSSAGSSAAVAAGCVPFAIGTETLGSIVSPSMRCGTTGLRPTFGAIPLEGAMTLCWSLDKAGPIARSSADAWTVFRALASTSSAPMPESVGAEVRGLKVGWVRSWFEGGGEARALEHDAIDALRDAGCELVEVSVPELPYETLRTILLAEAAASMEEWSLSGKDDQLAQQGADAWPNLFRSARFISAIDYIQADRLRRRVVDAFERMFLPIDAMIGPSFGNPMLLATNFTGQPCLVVRVGFLRRRPRDLRNRESGGEPLPTPHGISLWARPHDESVLARLGSAIESRLGVAESRPAGL